MNTPTPTPRTDDNEDGWAYNFQYDSFCSLIDDPLPWAEFSRTLERELTIATEQRDRLAEACQYVVDSGGNFSDLLSGQRECRQALQSLNQPTP